MHTIHTVIEKERGETASHAHRCRHHTTTSAPCGATTLGRTGGFPGPNRTPHALSEYRLASSTRNAGLSRSHSQPCFAHRIKGLPASLHSSFSFRGGDLSDDLTS